MKGYVLWDRCRVHMLFCSKISHLKTVKKINKVQTSTTGFIASAMPTEQAFTQTTFCIQDYINFTDKSQTERHS